MEDIKRYENIFYDYLAQLGQDLQDGIQGSLQDLEPQNVELQRAHSEATTDVHRLGHSDLSRGRDERHGETGGRHCEAAEGRQLVAEDRDLTGEGLLEGQQGLFDHCQRPQLGRCGLLRCRG